MNKALKGSIPAVMVVFTLAFAAWGAGCGATDSPDAGNAADQGKQDEPSSTNDEPSSTNDEPSSTNQVPSESGHSTPSIEDVYTTVAGDGIFLGLNVEGYDFSALLPFYITPNGDNASLYETEEVTFTLGTDSQDKFAVTLSEEFDIPVFLVKPYLDDPKKLIKITGTEAGSLEAQTQLTLLDDTPMTAPIDDSRITVIQYTPEQIAMGESYYASNGCTGCHAGADSGAPAHTLGLVVLMSDERIVKLLEDGTPFIPGTEVTFEHDYTFDSMNEKGGIAGYLRALQEKDVDTLVSTVVDSGDLSIFGF